MTTLDLTAIRARVAAATEGPWRLITDHCDCCDGLCSHGAFPWAIRLPIHTVRDADKPCEPGNSLDSYRHTASEFSDLTMETAEFIAHAREDVAALLAEVDRLRTQLYGSHRDGADPMPVFVIQAKDEFAISIVSWYRRLCEARGLDRQAAQVRLAAAEISAWRERNPAAVKLPDHQHVSVLPTKETTC